MSFLPLRCSSPTPFCELVGPLYFIHNNSKSLQSLIPWAGSLLITFPPHNMMKYFFITVYFIYSVTLLFVLSKIQEFIFALCLLVILTVKLHSCIHSNLLMNTFGLQTLCLITNYYNPLNMLIKSLETIYKYFTIFHYLSPNDRWYEICPLKNLSAYNFKQL